MKEEDFVLNMLVFGRMHKNIFLNYIALFFKFFCIFVFFFIFISFIYYFLFIWEADCPPTLGWARGPPNFSLGLGPFIPNMGFSLLSGTGLPDQVGWKPSHFSNRSGIMPDPNSPARSEYIHSPLHAKTEKTMNSEVYPNIE